MNHSDKNAKKMESLGQMTRGLIHDFNNSLASIMGYAEFLTSDLPLGSEQYLFADNIRKAGFQLQDLIDQIRAISAEKNTGKDICINLVPEIQNLSERLQSYLSTGQHLVFLSDIDTATLTLPPHQLRTLISNVVKNAVDALEHQSGTVTIHLSEMTSIDAIKNYQFVNESLPLAPTHSPLVKIEIIDMGCGMDEISLGLATTQHFTTKSADAAHGIGLSVAKDILSYLDGGLRIATTPGTGTCVTLILPVEELLTSSATEEMSPPKHILVIEDRESVRHIVTTILTRDGHSVTDTDDGLMALDILRENPDQFDLLITDYNMPQINGKDLIHEIRMDFPELPIIVISGDEQNLDLVKNTDIKNLMTISKPLTSQKLNQVVSKITDRSQEI